MQVDVTRSKDGRIKVTTLARPRELAEFRRAVSRALGLDLDRPARLAPDIGPDLEIIAEPAPWRVV